MDRGIPDRVDIYGGTDPRMMPAYTVPEAAWHVGLPASTVRSWVLGRSYPSTTGERRFEPVVDIAAPGERLLSFVNLVEIQRLGRDSPEAQGHAAQGARGGPLAQGPVRKHAPARRVSDAHRWQGPLHRARRNTRSDFATWPDSDERGARAVPAKDRGRDADGMPSLLFPFTTSTHDEEAQPVIRSTRESSSAAPASAGPASRRWRSRSGTRRESRSRRCRRTSGVPDQIEAAIRYEFRKAA